MNLIDIRQVLTQILGFLLLVWILRRWAWAPLLGALEARRQRIADEFRQAEERRADAERLRERYESELKGIEQKARQRLQEAVAEGQRVAAEIKSQAHEDAIARLERAEQEIEREREKAKEAIKDQIIVLSLRTAEKVLRQKLDDSTQRRLAGEFIDEVGALQ